MGSPLDKGTRLMMTRETSGRSPAWCENRGVVRGDVLVIGASGLVGSQVRRAFSDRAVVATYHEAPAPGAARLDITDADAVRNLVRRVKPSVVVLAAAEAYVERCEKEPAATRRVNVDAAASVLDAARAVGATPVVFSSEYVFDGRAGPYGEQDTPNPISEYGRQKVELERLARRSERHLVCRTSGVFAWEAAGKNFVCQLIRNLRAGVEFVVPSDQVITPTYAPALARAVRELVDVGASGTFHVVGPRVLSRSEFAGLAARTFGLPLELLRPRPTAELGLAAPRPLNAGLRDDKLRATIGHDLLDPADALAAMRASER